MTQQTTQKLAEGKTKIIYVHPDDPTLVICGTKTRSAPATAPGAM